MPESKQIEGNIIPIEVIQRFVGKLKDKMLSIKLHIAMLQIIISFK